MRRRLPPLPDDVLELVWYFVRCDLRPRLRRQLKRDVRVSAASRIVHEHGYWLYKAYTLLLGRVASEHMALCAWKFLHVEGMTLEDVTDSKAKRIVPGDPDTRNRVVPMQVLYNAHVLWGMIPEPDVCPGHGKSPPHLVWGPPVAPE